MHKTHATSPGATVYPVAAHRRECGAVEAKGGGFVFFSIEKH
jgi:hypothetical protein